MTDRDPISSYPGVEDYIDFAESLKSRLTKLVNIQGTSKLQKKINAEIKFLNSLKRKRDVIQGNHLNSSNLGHYASLIHAAESLPGVVQILQPFTLPTRPDNLVVDVVCGQGHIWVKVIARKSQALHLVWSGQGQFGERDLVDQAEEYLNCAVTHPFNFSIPKVIFAFYNQITKPVAHSLEKLGVAVYGQLDTADGLTLTGASQLDNSIAGSGVTVEDDGTIVQTVSETTDNPKTTDQPATPDQPAGTDKQASLHQTPTQEQPVTSRLPVPPASPSHHTTSPCPHPDHRPNSQALLSKLVSCPPNYSTLLAVTSPTSEAYNPSITRVNLDVTSLIALVSSVTNGRCHLVFRDKVLSEQAAEERLAPVLPLISEYITGKELFVCETALRSFNTILDTLGGPGEKMRSAALMSRVKVVGDNPSQRAANLRCQGRIKERSKVVFGTGDTLEAVTVTSNMGFVRAAQSQGVQFPVFLHAARALTEQKEKLATNFV
ncbi:UPF0415 protein C7orf25 homolog [Physella acuta]|uniref:UPF0415 protein C7orf25 homolog n=1 Tax=Physella acuta TaxID=109671 RepID=UPI0027DB6974|nr:UPF0415 protein C7orf25 homolog [Physella acuta]XP_059155670.1 UPF0415 protein C7orf25 homolog [Physella acuta]XP_059155671.1 UPF0415 protein C7orf25 homolog [Physella acuta]XP_059155672.1 UPF0415 protein C7orf25 homolog [Physella acuta]XP_059155674.1 UPF0415 protein C7orf25 homolog [Physella acuta]XP_059155675.1 UPF0415 protein C7orf25 homolog [Physella acuta]XP_059155676.1 UPF0415 protein C7orf25 homolog [Physella acuta]XP_059155677.1 UPF0415 protein C7orf25 homolog [Physella acuta]XP_